jgi:cytochrome c
MKSTMLWGLALVASTAWAQVPELFKGADLKQGEQMMAEHKCTACHQKQVGGDGHAIYKPKGRINSLGALRGMVEMCNTNLNLGLFPEDVNSIAAVLNRDHYHFSK